MAEAQRWGDTAQPTGRVGGVLNELGRWPSAAEELRVGDTSSSIDAHFLRRIVEAACLTERHFASARFKERLSQHARDVLNTLLGPLQSGKRVSLVDGETLLLAIDETLGDGSGAVLSRAGEHLASVYFFDTLAGRPTGDVALCLERLRWEVLWAFDSREVTFDVTRISTGLELEIRVTGAPRITRVLRHLSVGFVQAAFAFAFEASSCELRVYAELTGDRCSLTARYRKEATSALPQATRRSHRPSLAPARPSLAAEVDRILNPKKRSEWPAAEVNQGADSDFGAAEIDPFSRLPRPPRLPHLPRGTGS